MFIFSSKNISSKRFLKIAKASSLIVRTFSTVCFLSIYFLFAIGVCWAGEDAKSLSLENEIRQLKDRVNLLESLPEPNDYDLPKLTIRGFGHAQYDAESGEFNKGSANNFTLGGVDLFITSRIARNLFFLNETVFEFDKAGANRLDVERVLLKYEFANWLKISGGRGHTALGYWNQRYHHGVWLQTTVNRPILYRFEDQGGILPVHFVGVEVAGLLKFNAGQITYIANVANGRGKITDEVQLIKDDNNNKMFNGMFTFEPAFLDGVGFGANILFDKIPTNPGVAGRGSEIDEVIGGVHFFWVDDPVEFIVEASIIHHNSNVEKNHVGGYAQLAYQIGDFKPYYRFDYLEIDEGDPFFAGLVGVEDIKGHTFGVRYEWFPFAAIKGEFRMKDAVGEEAYAGTLQFSFAF